jgi:hypothetical protein
MKEAIQRNMRNNQAARALMTEEAFKGIAKLGKAGISILTSSGGEPFLS